MKYDSGESIMVGDIVRIAGVEGVVVFVVSSGQYSSGYPEKEWNYLNKGFGVETEKFGLIHQEEPDEDLVLIKSSST